MNYSCFLINVDEAAQQVADNLAQMTALLAGHLLALTARPAKCRWIEARTD